MDVGEEAAAVFFLPPLLPLLEGLHGGDEGGGVDGIEL